MPNLINELEKLPLTWDEQIQRILSLINIARISILFSLLIFLAIIHNLKESINAVDANTSTYLPLVQHESWLQIWCAIYGLIIMFSIAKPSWQQQTIKGMPNASAVLDISMIAALTALAGGVSSGFGILALPFLATSCVLSYGQFPVLYGSYAALLVLAEMFWRFYPFDAETMSRHLPLLTGQVLLIAAGYIVPLLTSLSARHLARTDHSLRNHHTAYERLSGLNKIVLNRVQEAVIVLDKESRIWLHNRQAKHYFPDLQAGEYAFFLNPLTNQWRIKPTTTFKTQTKINGTLMHIRAMPLIQEKTELLTLFIRSDRERQMEAQTLKLTSLGLLTANLAHEIRNPLSAMRQANGLLQEVAEEENNPMINKLNSIIEKNIARIDKMIEDISALNKRDRINTEKIEFIRFWYNFLQEFYITRPEAKGCLKLESDNQNHEIAFDAMHLQQIMWNLCNNAWRHCQKRKHSIIVHVHAQNAAHLSICVWDDGAGVNEETREHLFEPFYTTQAEGTGLGLYVARELAHANRGDLHYLPQVKSFELIVPRNQHEPN